VEAKRILVEPPNVTFIVLERYSENM